MKRLPTICICLLFFFSVNAQSSFDALRYSTVEIGGTARSIGIGGGIGALGGDFAVSSTNPAGMAVYRTSEFNFSPGVDLLATESQLIGTANGIISESETKFNFNQLGIVLHAKPKGASKWQTANFSVGFNRIADFREEFYYEGQSTGSITDRFLERSFDTSGRGLSPGELDDFESGPAYDAIAIYDADFDPDNDDFFWTSDFDFAPNALIERSQRVKRTGAINELVLSYAGNLNNRFLLGVTLGIPFLKYTEEKEYRESDPNRSVDFFDNLSFTETLTTKGNGLNLKLGMIYWATPKLRFGAALHTSTRYNLKDDFTTRVEYTLTTDLQGTETNAGEPQNPLEFEYRLKTPWRFIGSAGLIVPKFGFLSLEAEWLDYSGANFDLTSDSDNPGDAAYQNELNNEISQDFKGALTVRLGGEYAMNKFRFRAGYSISGSPLENGDINNNALSLGLGFRQDKYFIDLAYRGNQRKGDYTPYRLANPANEQVVEQNFSRNKILMTVGFKF